jgi:hypothetical protein
VVNALVGFRNRFSSGGYDIRAVSDVANPSCVANAGHYYLYDNVFQRQLNIPMVYWRQYNSVCTNHQQVNLYYTYLLRVIDMAAAGVGSVTVKINNSYNTEVVNKTTNADGYLLDEQVTVTAATGTTVTDSSKSWTVDDHRGKEFYFTSGANAGNKFVVKSNTATQLTFHDTVSPTPSANDRGGFPVFLRRMNMTHDDSKGEGAGSAFEIRTDYNPFTLTVSKSGYLVNGQKFSIITPTSEVIVLEKDSNNRILIDEINEETYVQIT